jgi:acylphosphatase
MKHLSINVTGTVQGVFFRASAKKVANELGINGFVRNENDGTVYIEAEGPEEKLIKFTDWCRQGPPRSSVKEVITREGDLENFQGFEIRL